MADIDNIVDYYASLLIIQYHNKPKAKAMVELFVREMLAAGIIFDVRDGYDVETAVGTQLDIIGKYVGIDRYYTGQTLEGFFSFISYDEVTTPPAGRIGFSVYGDFETKEGKTLKYSDILSENLILGDDDYRILIKLKILQNNSDHSHQSIDEAIYAFFGNDVIADSEGGMVMYYFVPVNMSAITKVAFQKNALPKPMGVRLNYLIEHAKPFFAFTTYAGTNIGSPFITGFTTYAEYDTKEGEILNYSKLIS